MRVCSAIARGGHVLVDFPIFLFFVTFNSLLSIWSAMAHYGGSQAFLGGVGPSIHTLLSTTGLPRCRRISKLVNRMNCFGPLENGHRLADTPWETDYMGDNVQCHRYQLAPWQQRHLEESSSKGTASRALEDMSAMEKIVSKLRELQRSFAQSGKPVEIKDSPQLPDEVVEEHIILPPKDNLFSIGRNWTTPDHPVAEPGYVLPDDKFPWEKDEKVDEEERIEKEWRVKPPTLAELTIPPKELARIRQDAMQLRHAVKIGKLGVTDGVVAYIKEKWHTSELVQVKCQGPLALNMKKIHQDLEQKSGGLVVFRSSNIVVIYRGQDYDKENRIASSLTNKLEGLISPTNIRNPMTINGLAVSIPSAFEENNAVDTSTLHVGPDTDLTSNHVKEEEQEKRSTALNDGVGSHIVERVQNLNVQPDPFVDHENDLEIEKLLDGLGPRYDSWTGLKPVPVDADLLPSIIPDYQPPYRLLPYGLKPRLTDAEFTNLRRSARPLAPHFVLGRNRSLQGLAAAMIKLWEKSEIAKIAVKRGVQNTNNERMAEELKRLTGGVLLGRDKFIITFYRGKDFLPEKVAAVLSEREAIVRAFQEEEEQVRDDKSIAVKRDSAIQPSIAVVAKKSSYGKPSWVEYLDVEEELKLRKKAATSKQLALAREMERKLMLAVQKKARAEKEVSRVAAFLKPVERLVDTEPITKEERFMLRKLGLKMHAFLVIGQRGVFDGVVENMHLHWKHRELVKIIIKERELEKVQNMAKMLESESGGVLIAIVTTSKGQAIIIYRGKNYQQPSELRPRNLLTKREALKRCKEMQRQMSLTGHIQELEKDISKMKINLKEMNEMEDASTSSQAEEGGSNPEIKLEHDSTMEKKIVEEKRKNLENLARAGPIFRAAPLCNAERLKLRKEALTSKKISQFNIGKSNALLGIGTAIRLYFLHHALAKVGVRGRGHGMPLQDLIQELESLTGGVLVSQEPNFVILYRGWPECSLMPSDESLEELSPELHAALEAEDDWEDNDNETRVFLGERESIALARI